MIADSAAEDRWRDFDLVFVQLFCMHTSKKGAITGTAVQEH